LSRDDTLVRRRKIGDGIMTKAYSSIDDNGGRCERCNKDGSEYLEQRTVKVLLGGGMGWGTLWVCSSCLDAEEKEKQDICQKV